MRPKIIFITGATGFVGSNIACKFLECGYRLKLLVRGENAEERVDRLFCKIYRQAEEYNKIKRRLEVIKGDITKENLGISLKDADRLSQEVGTIFHCAASVSFDETKKDEIERQNLGGTENILKFMRKLNLQKFHYISTAYVAGQRKGAVYEDELDKGQTFNNSYEESKFKAEKLVREYQDKYSIKATIYRPAIIVGDSRTGRTSSFFGFYGLIKHLWTLIELFKEDFRRGGRRAKTAGVSLKSNTLILPLRVPGLISKTLNLVPIDYVVKVVIRIFNREDAHNKIYHIINPTPPTIDYIQKAINTALKVKDVRVVDLNEFQTNPMTRWERFFSEMIKDYRPYLEREEPVFFDENTQYILRGTSIHCPSITFGLISKLIAYCIHTNWGKEQ